MLYVVCDLEPQVVIFILLKLWVAVERVGVVVIAPVCHAGACGILFTHLGLWVAAAKHNFK